MSTILRVNFPEFKNLLQYEVQNRGAKSERTSPLSYYTYLLNKNVNMTILARSLLLHFGLSEWCRLRHISNVCILVKIPQRIDQLEDLDMDGKIILKCI